MEFNKLSRKGKKKKLDDLFKKRMKQTRKYECVTCKKWGRSPAKEDLQWGHLITATKLAVRYYDRNVHWQCPSCNLLHEQYPEKYTEWYIDTYGLESWKELLITSNKVIMNYDKFYLDMYNLLTITIKP